MNTLKFSKTHEWIKKEEDVYTIGITDYAAKELGDIVFIELPNLELELNIEQSFGIIESLKSVSDLLAPISGKVVAVNKDLETKPELLNKSPYEQGWILKIENKQILDFDKLLTKQEYDNFIKEEK